MRRATSCSTRRYEALPDRRLRDAFVRTGLDVMVRPGPLELLWWQWFALAALLLAAGVAGKLLGRIDQPFRVGDAVSVGGVTGVVESIGLRSTRLRTDDRTLIAISNGKLADERTESHAARDRFRLISKIGLSYATTREQLQTILAGVLRVLREHPRVCPEGATVSFASFGDSSRDIEVVAWFEVSTSGDFVSCREDVLLGIMRVVAAGTQFAFPTRTVHLQSAPAPSIAVAASAGQLRATSAVAK